MRKIWRLLRAISGWAVLAVSAILSLWSRYLDYRDAVALGLNSQVWLFIGLALFFVTVIVLLFQFHEQTLSKKVYITEPTQTDATIRSDRIKSSNPESYFQNKKLFIAELARDNPMVKEKLFEDCDLIGPAVVLFMSSTISHCSFDAVLEHMLIVVEEDRRLTGIVGFQSCIFRRCNFRNIGIVAKPDMAKEFAKGVSRKV